MEKKKFNLAVVGATGLVGVELVEALIRRRFPASSLRLFASLNSAGESVPFMGEDVEVEQTGADFAEGRDIVFFAAHPMVSRDLAPEAARAGAIVIDSSNAFRMDPEVPLVVPEVNAEALAGIKKGKRIVASPSPAAVALSLLLYPIDQAFGVKAVSAVTVHGTTFGGRRGFEEHQYQSIGVFNQGDVAVEKFPRRTAFNIFPRVGEFNDHGDAEAERELREELPRILGASFPVSATAMMAPVFCGLAAVVSIELGGPAPEVEFRKTLEDARGIKLMDDPAEDLYPDTVLSMEYDDVLVGRIRKDPSRKNGYVLWISADNLRKGSSDNMAAIAELVAKFGDDL